MLLVDTELTGTAEHAGVDPGHGVRVRVRVRLKISQHHHWYAHSHLTSRIVHHTGCDGILPLGVWKPTYPEEHAFRLHKSIYTFTHLTKRRFSNIVQELRSAGSSPIEQQPSTARRTSWHDPAVCIHGDVVSSCPALKQQILLDR